VACGLRSIRNYPELEVAGLRGGAGISAGKAGGFPAPEAPEKVYPAGPDES